MEKYTVIYTDFGDSCDGSSVSLGTFSNLSKAQQEMQEDVKYFLENDLLGLSITESKPTSVFVGNYEQGCKWQIVKTGEKNEH